MRVKTLLTIGAMSVFSFSALAEDGHDKNNNNNNNDNSSFRSSVIGSATGLTIGGVNSAGAPWVVSEGQASVSGSGRIRVEVQGLLLGAGAPADLVGTTGPVTMVGATLVCGGSGGAVVPEAVAVTPSPLSPAGNAEIEQDVTLPAACFGPVVVVRIFSTATTQLGPFIAASGLMPNAAPNPNPTPTPNPNQNQNDHGGGGHGH
jgi:hypothetical protein